MIVFNRNSKRLCACADNSELHNPYCQNSATLAKQCVLITFLLTLPIFFLSFFPNRVVPVEEREAKFFRFISSSFHALSYFLRTVAPSQLKNSAVTSSLDTLLHDKKLWKYVKNTSPLVSETRPFRWWFVFYCNIFWL